MQKRARLENKASEVLQNSLALFHECNDAKLETNVGFWYQSGTG